LPAKKTKSNGKKKSNGVKKERMKKKNKEVWCKNRKKLLKTKEHGVRKWRIEGGV